MATSVASGSSTDLPPKLKVTRNVATFVKSFYTRRKYLDDEDSTISIYYDFQDVSSESSSDESDDDSDSDFDNIPDPIQIPPSNWGGHESSSSDEDDELDLASLLHIPRMRERKPSLVNQAAEKYAKTRLGYMQTPKGKKKKKKAQNESKEEKEGRLKFENALKLFQGPAKKLDVFIPWLQNESGKLETGMIVDEAEAKRAQEAIVNAESTVVVTYALPEEGAVGGAKEEAVDTTPAPYLVLPEISPVVYAMLFQGYMSTGRMPYLDYSLSWDLLKLAKMYNFPEPVLDEIRGHLFVEAWMESKCWVAYQEASNQNEKHLKDSVLLPVYSHFNNCADDPEFLYLEPEQLLSLVQTDCCIFEEHKIFQNCIAWARNRAARTIPGTDLVETINYPTFAMINQADSEEEGMLHSEPPEYPVDHKLVRKYMKPLLPHIRLFSIPRGMLRLLLQVSKIFRLSEIEMLCNPESDNPKTKDFRNFFCPLTTPRSIKPELKELFVYGYPESNKTSCYALMAYSPFYVWSCDFPLIKFRLKHLPHIDVHIHTQLKPEDKGETYQEKFRLVLCTPGDRRQVRHVSEMFSVKAKYNSSIQVQFNVPEVKEITDLQTELFVVYHCTGLYPITNPWITAEGEQGEATNEECTIL